jgi:glucose-6-phosphate 1-dehydrogenase
MEHCLLFGGQGHLARTKLIPNLENQNVAYTPISRKHKESVKHLYDNENVVAYMSIPTSFIRSHIEKYEHDFERISPLFVLEKPHGDSQENFDEICEYLDSQNYKYLFNDHYMFKNWARDLDHLSSSFPDIHTIQVDIKESGCINDRLDYFESSGILLDMYQSHVMMIFAKILSRIYPKDSLVEILETLSETKYVVMDSGKYPEYKGDQDTHVTIGMRYNKTTLVCNLKKNAGKYNKCIYLNSHSNCQRIPLDDSDGYDRVFANLRKEKYDDFMTKQQVDLLWRHIEFNN